MAINNPSISTSDNESEAQAWRLEMLDTQPDISPGAIFTELRPPNRVYGFYNGSSDMVEMYITSDSGNRWIRLTTRWTV